MGFFVMFLISLAITVAGELLRPKQKFDDAKPSALGDFSFPTADASRVIPWFWGTCKLQGPNTVWFGDYSMEPIVKTVKTGWFSSDDVTQGFKHMLGVQLIFAWGEIDEFIAWIADDKEVKIKDVVETADKITFYIYDPTFISADEPWSGLQGNVTLYKGTANQVANDYLAQQWADTEDEISAFRRVCYAVMEKCWIGNSETPPPFGITARRTPNQLGLTGGKHNVNGDSNVACAAYEVMTDTLKGLKIPSTKIDTASFIACGNTLFDEGLGVSMMVDTPMIGKDLLADMLRHVDGVIYPDPVTGLYTMALARKDYDVDTLPEFDDSNVETEGFDFTRSSWEETRNNITVNFTCREENFQVRPVTYQDLANVDVRNGAIDSETIDFLGFSNYTQARSAAERAGKTRSSSLAKASFTTNRDGYDLRPGSVLKLTKAKFKITGLVMRVIDISYGTLDDPRIRVTCIEDVFTVNAHAYEVSTGSGWTPPNGTEIAPLVRTAFEEAPYEMMGAELRGVMALGARDDSTNVAGFEVWSDPAGGTNYTLTAVSRGVVASGTLLSTYGITAADDPVGFAASAVEDIGLLRSITVDERAEGLNICKIGNEYMAWQTVVTSGGQATISKVLRGVFDTVQEVHPAGAVVWFFNETIPLSTSAPYPNDLTLKGKLMAVDRTRRQDITTDVSVPISLTTYSRAFRPNPPGKARLNGMAAPIAPAGVVGSFVLAWEHRNRTSKQVVSQDATGIASESGVAYLVEARNATTNALVASKSNLAGPTATVNLVTGVYDIYIYSVGSDGLRSYYGQAYYDLAVDNASGTNTITGVEGSGGDVVIFDGGIPSQEPPPTDTTGGSTPPSGGTGGTSSGGLPTLAIGATSVNVDAYGAVGNGTTDDTAAIQAAINSLPSGGGTVVGTAGKTYLVNPDYQAATGGIDTSKCGIKMKTGVFLDFSAAKVKLKLTNTDKRYGVCAFQINNFHIQISEITGYRDDPAWVGPTSTNTMEHGHNIGIYGCSTFIVDKTTTRKATGDGMSIGRGVSAVAASDGYVDTTLSTQNRRQGLSIGRSSNVRVTNSTFSATQGTAPQAGIDIEPDNPTTSNSTGTYIDNCILEDNYGPGIQAYKSADDVHITNCKIRRNRAGAGGVYAIDSSIGAFTGNEITDNYGWGLQLSGVTDNWNVTGNTFKNNRTASLGNHPGLATSTITGQNSTTGLHVKVASTCTAITIGSNTYSVAA